MMTIMWVLLFFAIILTVVGVLITLLTSYKIEIKPAQGAVYNNQWTGKTRCALWGTVILIPGLHKLLEKEVFFRNEPSDPPEIELVTHDRIKIKLDWIMRVLRIGYEGMPANLESPILDTERLKQCAIKAVTSINYKEREKSVISRVIACAKAAVGKYTYEELFKDADLKNGVQGKADKELLKRLQDEVNDMLKDDEATKDWGFLVQVDLEDISLPGKLRNAVEEKAAAEMAGQAIADKAQKSGVNPNVLVIADALGGLFGKGDK